MRIILFVFYATVFSVACNNNKTSDIRPIKNTVPPEDTIANFFPVTSFLKGEIFVIKEKGITPIRKITVGTHTDSSWLDMKNLEKEFSVFLSPVIDTANLKTLFAEKKFLDQTLNAFTFTYDPINEKADGFAFKHWDVYVDPDNNKVKRIYLIKKESADTDLQLTWQSGKWCKIVTLKNTNGNIAVAKEEKIYWIPEE